jgi:hypothetical protein
LVPFGTHTPLAQSTVETHGPPGFGEGAHTLPRHSFDPQSALVVQEAPGGQIGLQPDADALGARAELRTGVLQIAAAAAPTRITRRVTGGAGSTATREVLGAGVDWAGA